MCIRDRLMVDTQAGLAEQDKRIAALAIRNGVAVIVVLSKWDIISEEINPRNNGAMIAASGTAE